VSGPFFPVFEQPGKREEKTFLKVYLFRTILYFCSPEMGKDDRRSAVDEWRKKYSSFDIRKAQMAGPSEKK